MANSLSVASSNLSITHDDSEGHRCNGKPTSADNSLFPNALINDATNKCPIIATTACRMSDELLEIQQIEYEQCLIEEQIDRVDLQKKQLQELLKQWRSTNRNRKTKVSRHFIRRLQSLDSSSDFE